MEGVRLYSVFFRHERHEESNQESIDFVDLLWRRIQQKIGTVSVQLSVLIKLKLLSLLLLVSEYFRNELFWVKMAKLIKVVH